MLKPIGLTGGMCSGKDSWADLIALEFDYTHRSTSQIVRQFILEHELGEPTRDLTREVATKLRSTHGGDYLVRQTLMGNDRNIVVSGLYVEEEALTIRESGGIVVAVAANSDVRYGRMLSRARAGEGGRQDDFIRLDSNDMNSPDTDQRLERVIAGADMYIDGDIPIADLDKCLVVARNIVAFANREG